MLSRREFKRGLGLATAEVPVIVITGNRLIHGRQFGIDQKMMMTGVGQVGPGRCHTHTPETETDRYRVSDRVAIGRRNKIELGTGHQGGQKQREKKYRFELFHF